MRSYLGSLGLVLVILPSIVQGILILGPNRIFAGRLYTMVISNFLERSVDLSLTMERTINSNLTEILQTKSVDVRPNMNQLVDFNVPERLPNGAYRISITGTRGFSFHEEVPVVLESNNFYGLIQLDKPIYKPGDVINFRVVVLDSELKPPRNLPSVTISINIKEGVTVEEWNEAPLKIGVFEGKFQIAPAPVLGTYEIVVESDGEDLVSKTFEVKEYVLTGLNVDVFPTRTPLEVHQGVDLTVTAKNVFGESVSGSIDLMLEDDINLIKVRANREVHGMGKFTMRFNRDLYMTDDLHEMNLTWTFTEHYTNRTVAKSLKITIFKSMYRVELEKETSGFFPGYPFNATIKIESQDGLPGSNLNCTVEVDGTEENKFELISDENGEIPLQLLTSESDEIITVTVSLGGQELLEEEIHKAVTNRNAFIKIALKSEVHINMPIKLKVKCRKEVQFFMYYVLAKGNVIDQGYIRVNRKVNVNLVIGYSDGMVPKATVFVVTVSGKTVIYDMKDIVFRDLSNNFDMEIATDLVNPGDQIQLDMRGRPNSYVALAAYDKALLQYGSTHDLLWSDVRKLYDNFYKIENNEFDIFQSLGLFAKVSANFQISQASSTTVRQGQTKFAKLTPYRTNFAESFLWMSTTIERSGRKEVIKFAPDSTTSWCVTGFSMDPTYGLGIVKKPLLFNTIKAFYIVDHLPYSIKQEEIVVLQFTVFNNLGGNYITKITLFNVQNQFEFMETEPNTSNYSKTLTIPQSVGTPVSFFVKAKKLGEMAVRVKATNLLETDAIEKVIRVMPQTLMQYKSETRIFSHDNFKSAEVQFIPSILREAEPGTVKLSLVVEPNVLSEVSENLGNLIRVPTGSGESNMINFVPNVAVLDYLTATNSNNDLINKAQSSLKLGYQNQLKYRLADGSFKDFEGSNSSIFLTAFVAKSMQTAHKYLPEVDVNMVNQAFDWLASQQHPSGRFEEIGPTVLKDFQTTSRNSIALTSYVLIAFLENPNTRTNHSKVITNGIDYILKHKGKIEDVLDLAMAAYALSLHDISSTETTSFKDKLIDKGDLNHINMTMHWQRETHSIETTSYALLTILKDPSITTNGIMIMRWLVNQRYETGSFPRTQDTFLGLKALTALANVISPSNNDYSITLTIPAKDKIPEKKHNFPIPTGEIQPSKFDEIPDNTRKLFVKFDGKGFSLIKLKYEFGINLKTFNNTQHFILTMEKITDSNNELKMEICGVYKPKLVDERSNMAQVEVNFPSGYVVDKNPIIATTNDNPIQNIEIRFGATSVVVYYASMGIEKNCFIVTAYRRFLVSLKRPAYIIVRDYYAPEKYAIHVYNTEQDES